MGDFWRRTGLLPGTAHVLSVGAPAAAIRQGRILRARYGPLLGVADGTTDNVEIQAAIAALPAGGKLQLSVGEFNLAATIVGANYLTVEGVDKGRSSEPPDTAGGTVLVQVANFTPILNLDNTDGVVLHNFKIRGGHGTYALGRAIQAVGTDWLTIRQLSLNGIVGEAIYGEYSGGRGAGWWLQDIYARTVGAEGAYLWGIVDSWLDNVVASNCAGEAGIWVRQPGDLILKGCRADWNTKCGFFIYGGSNVSLVACVADHNNHNGLLLSEHTDSVFSGLRVFNNGRSTGGVWQFGAGLRLLGSLRNVVLGGRFHDTQTPKTQQYGMLEDGISDYNRIAWNDVSGNGTAGIYSPLAGKHTTVRDNSGYLAQAEARTDGGALAQVVQNGAVIAWQNPEHQAALVSATVRITTAGGAAATGPMGLTTSVVVEDCEDAWNESVLPEVTSTLNTTDFERGTGSAQLAVAAGVVADEILATEARAAQDLSGYTHLLFKIKSSVATVAADLRMLISENANCVAPAETLAVPALIAGQWTLVVVPFVNAGATRDAIVSIGLQYHANPAVCTILIDDVRAVTIGATMFAGAAVNLNTAPVVYDSMNVADAGAGLGKPIYMDAKNGTNDVLVMVATGGAAGAIVGSYYIQATGV